MLRKLGKSLVGALAVLFAAAPLVLAQISGTGPSGQTGTGPAGPGNTGTGPGNMGSLPDRPSTGSERSGTQSPGQADSGSIGSRPATPGEGSMSGQSDPRKGIDSPHPTRSGASSPTTEPSDTGTRK
jgi:eukaryotic-like serine/threonine-protein kinase